VNTVEGSDGPVGMEPPEQQMTGEDVEALFPLWSTWTGGDALCYALRTQGAALTVSGRTWAEIPDEIREAEKHLRTGLPAPNGGD